MLGEGTRQYHITTAGSTRDTIATTVHPVKDLVPDR
jgi:hypothetical protein